MVSSLTIRSLGSFCSRVPFHGPRGLEFRNIGLKPSFVEGSRARYSRLSIQG